MGDVIQPVIPGSGTSNGCAYVASSPFKHPKALCPTNFDITINSGDIFTTLDSRYVLHYGGGIGAPSSGTYQIFVQSSNQSANFLLLDGGTYDFTVDWDDPSGISTITSFDDPDKNHEYDEDNDSQFKVLNVQGTMDDTILRIGFRSSTVGSLTNYLLYRIYEWGPFKNTVASGCAKNFNLREVPRTPPEINASGFNNLFNSCETLIDGEGPDSDSGSGNLYFWDTSSITDFRGCFAACDQFNGPVQNWDVSNAESLAYMFINCFDFNQDLSNWNTSNCKNFAFMFSRCNIFDQDLSSWDFTAVTGTQNLNSFVYALSTGLGLSPTNYGKLLATWESQASLIPTNQSISLGALRYDSAGQAAKAVLTASPYNWTITDGGLAP